MTQLMQKKPLIFIHKQKHFVSGNPATGNHVMQKLGVQWLTVCKKMSKSDIQSEPMPRFIKKKI